MSTRSAGSEGRNPPAERRHRDPAQRGGVLRCNDRFAEDTLTLRIATVTPDSLRFEEPFRLVIPRDESPAPLKREVAVPYRLRIRFTQSGDYRCILTPTRPVRGVEAVGINLTKSE